MTFTSNSSRRVRRFNDGMTLSNGEMLIEDFETMASLAQYKNTHHVGTGYFLDTVCCEGHVGTPAFPLRDLFRMVLEAFGIDTIQTAPSAVL